MSDALPPELRAKVLEWQHRHNIADNDPAMALIELLNLYYRPGQTSAAQTAAAPVITGPVNASISTTEAEQLASTVRSKLAPALEQLTDATNELRARLDSLQFDELSKQMGVYFNGIDYATKKLDVIKKDSDAMFSKLSKIGHQINPVARGAVIGLMLVAGFIGYLAAIILR